MKAIFYKIFISLLSQMSLIGGNLEIQDVISPRLIELCAETEITDEDVTFLNQMTTKNGPSECLSRAILFRHFPIENKGEFRKFFSIDHSIPQTVIKFDQKDQVREIDLRVNNLINKYSGRHPAEIFARVYLLMRKSGIVGEKPDGTKFNVEFNCREEVFLSITGCSKKEALRLAEEADKK